MKLIAMISAFPLTILIVGLAGILLYKKTLRQKSWFGGLQLKFESADCPHTKAIPYAQLSGLTFKRKEKYVKKTVLNKSDITRDVTYRLACGECGRKRNFRLVRTPEAIAYEKHRLLYIFGTFGAIFLVYGFLVAPVLTFIFNVFNL